MNDTPADHPMRRSTDSLWGRAVGVWRNIMPVVALGIAAWAVFVASQKVDHAELRADHAALIAQRNLEGRKIAIAVTCSAISAVIDAGRATIGASVNVSPKFERNLRRLGYPPKPQRRVNARRAAQAYARSIANAVARETQVKGLVRKDGTLNCERLKKVSKAG